MRDLLARPWRGNARELRGHLEQAVVMRDGSLLDVNDPAPPVARAAPVDDGAFVPLHAMIEETERRHITMALQRSGRSVTRTAELLGISRQTLWEKMKRLGLSA